MVSRRLERDFFWFVQELDSGRHQRNGDKSRLCAGARFLDLLVPRAVQRRCSANITQAIIVSVSRMHVMDRRFTRLGRQGNAPKRMRSGSSLANAPPPDVVLILFPLKE